MQIKSSYECHFRVALQPLMLFAFKTAPLIIFSAARQQCRSDYCAKWRFFQNERRCHNDVARAWAARARVHSARILFSSLALAPAGLASHVNPVWTHSFSSGAPAQRNTLGLSKLLMTPIKLIHCRLTASARIPGANGWAVEHVWYNMGRATCVSAMRLCDV